MTEPDGPTREDLERAILGEQPSLTAADMAQAAGGEWELARRLWRALGFPEYQHELAFTEADARALRLLGQTIEAGYLDVDTAMNLTRAVGQTMARLADWEVASLVPRLEPGGDSQARLAQALELVTELTPTFEQLVIYTWRRHLAAAVARVDALAGDEDLPGTEVTVGFADIVSFTALSNEMDEDRIGDLVEIFESRCHDVIAAHRGRAIKSLGDSVLFVSDDPVAAIEIAEGIISVIGRDARLPDVRLGLASGPVVMRMGDVFGPPVNLAARLTAVARRNRLIIDEATARLLPPEEFESRRLPARPIRGFGLVEPVAVRHL